MTTARVRSPPIPAEKVNFQTKENSRVAIPTSTNSPAYCLQHYRTFLPPSILSFHLRVPVLTCTVYFFANIPILKFFPL